MTPEAAPVHPAPSASQLSHPPIKALGRDSAIYRHVFSRIPDEPSRQRASDLFLRIEGLPFVDIHTHYSEFEIHYNRRYATPTEFFIGTYGAKEGAWSSPFDHYLGNLLRRQGVPQEFIYGKKLPGGQSDLDFDQTRFRKFIEAVSRERLNPVRIWMEITLERVLGITEIPVAAENADRLWKAVSEKLATPEFHARSLLNGGNVVAACTTDSPTADLAIHKQHNESGHGPLLLPTFRPDAALLSPRVHVADFVADLARSSGQEINTISEFKEAIAQRMQFFAERGCKAMDVGFDNFYVVPSSPKEQEHIFKQLLSRQKLTELEEAKWKAFALQYICEKAASHQWTIYLHQGAARDTRTSVKSDIGTDAGADTQGPRMDMTSFQLFLDNLDRSGALHKVVLFPINSGDWEAPLTKMQPFQHGRAGVACPLQLGPPWWFNDTIEGMEKWLDLIKVHSSYADSVGMLSDSRVLHTVISRNLLFRAVLSSWLVRNAAGADDEVLFNEAKAICYDNAAKYLGIN